MFLYFSKILTSLIIIFSFQFNANCQDKNTIHNSKKDSIQIVREVKKQTRQNKKNAKLSYMVLTHQQQLGVYNKHFLFSTNLLNPLSWLKFFESFKNGDFKNKQ